MAVSRSRLSQQERDAEGDRLYEEYGKPLEAEHWGEFVAISSDGRVLIGATLRDVVREAKDVLGPGNFVFKIGPRVVGRIR